MDIIVFGAVGQGNGGVATLEDLVLALEKLGHNVLRVSSFGSWTLAAGKMFVGPLFGTARRGGRLITYLDLGLPDPRTVQLRPWWHLRRIGASVLRTLDRIGSLQSRKSLTGVGIAVVGDGTPPEELRRVLPGVQLVFNHAGSPDTFAKWWNPAESASEGWETYRQQLHGFDRVLFQAECHATDSVNRGAISGNAAVVLRPSCDESRLLSMASSSSPFADDRVSLVCVGSLQERKAQHVALHALATVAHKFPTVDLHLVGGHTDSGYGAELVALSESLGLESRVYFWGHRQIYEPFLIHADVVLQTSIAEGVSRVLRESAFLGKPIIATDISGSRECLGDDGCWFTTPGSQRSLALVLEQVLNECPSWIERGKAAQARYRELFSQDRYESDLGRIIQRLQVRRSGPS